VFQSIGIQVSWVHRDIGATRFGSSVELLPVSDISPPYWWIRMGNPVEKRLIPVMFCDECGPDSRVLRRLLRC